MITYNHKTFVAQAIESVLMQQTNFDYELVIGEDCSIDTTREIVSDYQRRHPGKIRLLLNNKNLGMIHNFVKTLQNCEGQYIAILEGDDYWIDPLKLRKQVDFLDRHPECAICFHNVMVINKDGKRVTFSHHLYEKKEMFTLEDLLSGNFIHTCSVLFRRGLFNDFPQWYYQCQMGDWPLHILNAQHGDIGFINTAMAVYRVHDAGLCSSQNDVEIKINSICAARKICQSLNDRQKKILNRTITLWHEQLLTNTKTLFKNREFDTASYWAKKCYNRFRHHHEISREILIDFFLIGYLPRLTYLIIKKSKAFGKYVRISISKLW